MLKILIVISNQSGEIYAKNNESKTGAQLSK
jgi:hypothetical protein